MTFSFISLHIICKQQNMYIIALSQQACRPQRYWYSIPTCPSYTLYYQLPTLPVYHYIFFTIDIISVEVATPPFHPKIKRYRPPQKPTFYVMEIVYAVAQPALCRWTIQFIIIVLYQNIYKRFTNVKQQKTAITVYLARTPTMPHCVCYETINTNRNPKCHKF